jgi:valyl-tRNA synthetase
MNGEDEDQKQTTRSVLSYVLDRIMRLHQTHIYHLNL